MFLNTKPFPRIISLLPITALHVEALLSAGTAKILRQQEDDWPAWCIDFQCFLVKGKFEKGL
jgi:hypothetical protein